VLIKDMVSSPLSSVNENKRRANVSRVARIVPIDSDNSNHSYKLLTRARLADPARDRSRTDLLGGSCPRAVATQDEFYRLLRGEGCSPSALATSARIASIPFGDWKAVIFQRTAVESRTLHHPFIWPKMPVAYALS